MAYGIGGRTGLPSPWDKQQTPIAKMATMSEHTLPAILNHDSDETSVFLPGNLMESARRQKGLPHCQVPLGCLLDFDGELAEYLNSSGRARLDPAWPCFHTRLYRWTTDQHEFGIVGGTVGAPFAVLLAEELFACGCRALVSIGSAGLLAADLKPPFFLLIERSLRDEGTSYHYAPPAAFAEADRDLLNKVQRHLAEARITVRRGATWTTDAPFRETAERIADCRRRGITVVEMEAAALLAFAGASKRKVMCLSHVTNHMATQRDDFDKGGQTGQEAALRICEETLKAILSAEIGKGMEHETEET